MRASLSARPSATAAERGAAAAAAAAAVAVAARPAPPPAAAGAPVWSIFTCKSIITNDALCEPCAVNGRGGGAAAPRLSAPAAQPLGGEPLRAKLARRAGPLQSACWACSAAPGCFHADRLRIFGWMIKGGRYASDGNTRSSGDHKAWPVVSRGGAGLLLRSSERGPRRHTRGRRSSRHGGVRAAARKAHRRRHGRLLSRGRTGGAPGSRAEAQSAVRVRSGQLLRARPARATENQLGQVCGRPRAETGAAAIA